MVTRFNGSDEEINELIFKIKQNIVLDRMHKYKNNYIIKVRFFEKYIIL